jgi:hypothetical protein
MMSATTTVQPQLRRTPTSASVDSKDKNFIEEKVVPAGDDYTDDDSKAKVIQNAEDVSTEVGPLHENGKSPV